ncbi:hypothetical protein DM02DRAFT_630116 [Periconia macrospinosa]|uniref:Uncharacterized protein n=1 Tax=Periconia macrospinosa TaxID=97972 RepID=A0A2V1DKH9_9PLEO|nr:hypothetical protein DM02DRAFT_630116 [Periconia macrospinosa]
MRRRKRWVLASLSRKLLTINGRGREEHGAGGCYYSFSTSDQSKCMNTAARRQPTDSFQRVNGVPHHGPLKSRAWRDPPDLVAGLLGSSPPDSNNSQLTRRPCPACKVRSRAACETAIRSQHLQAPLKEQLHTGAHDQSPAASWWHVALTMDDRTALVKLHTGHEVPTSVLPVSEYPYDVYPKAMPLIL